MDVTTEYVLGQIGMRVPFSLHAQSVSHAKTEIRSYQYISANIFRGTGQQRVDSFS